MEKIKTIVVKMKIRALDLFPKKYRGKEIPKGTIGCPLLFSLPRVRPFISCCRNRKDFTRKKAHRAKDSIAKGVCLIKKLCPSLVKSVRLATERGKGRFYNILLIALA